MDQEIRVAINDEVGQDLLEDSQIVAIVSTVLDGEQCIVPCEVTVSFVDLDTIHALNRDYRGIDKPTDVLSFNIDDASEYDDGFVFDEFDESDEAFEEDLGADAPVFMLGDVIICPEVVLSQAPGFGNTPADEARLLVVHGCLHLMGYDHEDPEEAEEMEALERRYLATFCDAPVEELNVGPTVDHTAEGSSAWHPVS